MARCHCSLDRLLSNNHNKFNNNTGHSNYLRKISPIVWKDETPSHSFLHQESPRWCNKSVKRSGQCVKSLLVGWLFGWMVSKMLWGGSKGWGGAGGTDARKDRWKKADEAIRTVKMNNQPSRTWHATATHFNTCPAASATNSQVAKLWTTMTLCTPVAGRLANCRLPRPNRIQCFPFCIWMKIEDTLQHTATLKSQLEIWSWWSYPAKVQLGTHFNLVFRFLLTRHRRGSIPAVYARPKS